jgi:hypothetical protein
LEIARQPRHSAHAPPSREFKFKKRGQLFIRTHNEALSIVAMRVSNPERSPVEINR